MAGDSDLELRVSRLENDVSSSYELIADVRTTQVAHSQRFDQMDTRFDGVDQRFDRVESTLGEIIRRLPEPS